MSALEILEDACAALPYARRAMFGGHGLFAPNGGIFAAVVDDDRIVLKFVSGTDAHEAFVAAGGRAWTYRERMTMREWLLVPEDLHDEPAALATWCARAHREAPPSAKKPKRAGRA